MNPIERIRKNQLSVIQKKANVNSLNLAVCHSFDDTLHESELSANQSLLQFLESKHRVLLLLGDAGSGKTVLFHEAANYCWQYPERYVDCQTKPVLPLFLSLAHWKGPLNELITDYLTTHVGLEQAEIKKLQQTYTCLLILDAYDLSNRHDFLWPRDETVSPQWQISQMLVNCRVEYFLQHEKYLDYFIFLNDPPILFYLRSLSPAQITAYLQSHPAYQPTWLNYLNKPQTGLKSLVENPLFLTFLPQYLTTHPQDFTEEAYLFLFQQWFQYQENRLGEVGYLQSYQGNFIEHCWVYTRAIALKLKESLSIVIDFDSDTGPYHQTIQKQWERFFTSETRQTWIVRQACPWRLVKQNQLLLYHKAILDYFSNLTNYPFEKYSDLPFIRGDEGVENITERLNQKEFDLVSHVVGIIVGDYSKLDYFRLVYLSRAKESFASIAANAISVLNAASTCFSGMDLSYIKIPGANLAGAVCDRTNFYAAGLRAVNFQQAWLRHANFQESIMENINLGEFSYLEHPGKLDNIIFSPDGNVLATTIRGENNVYIWRWRHNRLVLTLKAKTERNASHLSSINTMQFSPNTEFLATGGQNTPLSIWKLDIEKLHIIYLKENQHPDDVAEAWRTTKNNDSRINILLMKTINTDLWYIWGVPELKSYMPHWDYKPKLIEKDCDLGRALKKLQSKILSKEEHAEILDQALKYLNRHSINEKSEINTDEICYPYEIEFSTNNKFIIVATDIGAKLFDLEIKREFGYGIEKLKTIFCFREKSEKVLCVRFAPDSQYLISGCDDYKIRLWHVTSRKLIHVYTGHTREIQKVEFCPSRTKLFLSIDSEGLLKLWDMQSDQTVYSSSANLGAYFSPNGFTFTIYNDKNAYVLSTINFALLSSFNNTYLIQQVQYSPDSNMLAIRGETTVELWDIQKKQIIRQIAEHTDKICQLSFNPYENIFATASWDHTVRLWNLKSTENNFIPTVNSIADIYSDQPKVPCLSTYVDENTNLLATGSLDHVVRILDQKTGQCSHNLLGHTDSITCVQFSSDGKLLATGSTDQTIRLWQVLTGDLVYMLQGHQYHISCLQFNPSGTWLASGSKDKTVQLWNVLSGAPIGVIHQCWDDVLCLQFSPNGKLLVSGGEDRIIRVWNIEKKQAEIELRGYSKKIQSLKFSDNNLLISRCEDHSVKVWRRVDKNLLIDWQLQWSSIPSLYAEEAVIGRAQYMSLTHQSLLEQRGANSGLTPSKSMIEDSFDIPTIANRIKKFSRDYKISSNLYIPSNYQDKRENNSAFFKVAKDIIKSKKETFKKLFDTCIEQYPEKLDENYAVLLLNGDEIFYHNSDIEYAILVDSYNEQVKKYFLAISQLLELLSIENSENYNSKITINFILGLKNNNELSRENFVVSIKYVTKCLSKKYLTNTELKLFSWILPNATFTTGNEKGFDLYQKYHFEIETYFNRPLNTSNIFLYRDYYCKQLLEAVIPALQIILEKIASGLFEYRKLYNLVMDLFHAIILYHNTPSILWDDFIRKLPISKQEAQQIIDLLQDIIYLYYWIKHHKNAMGIVMQRSKQLTSALKTLWLQEGKLQNYSQSFIEKDVNEVWLNNISLNENNDVFIEKIHHTLEKLCSIAMAFYKNNTIPNNIDFYNLFNAPIKRELNYWKELAKNSHQNYVDTFSDLNQEEKYNGINILSKINFPKKLKSLYLTKEQLYIHNGFLNPIPIEYNQSNLVILGSNEIYSNSLFSRNKKKKKEPKKYATGNAGILLDRIDKAIDKNELAVLDVEDIFNQEKSPKHVLIVGNPQVGKTTLCQYITSQWARDRLWKDKFETVFWIKLQRPQSLEHYQNPTSLANIILRECLESDKQEGPVTEEMIEQYLKIHTKSVLILVDGYDKLSSHSVYRKAIDAALANSSLCIILTSRYCSLPQECFDLKLEHIGLANKNIHNLIRAFFPAAPIIVNNIMDFLQKNSRFSGLARMPINLALVCYAWSDIEKNHNTQSQFNITLLYQTMAAKLINDPLRSSEIKKRNNNYLYSNSVMFFLERIAFIGLYQNQTVIQNNLIKSIISEINQSKNDDSIIKISYIEALGLLVPVNNDTEEKDYCFINIIFQNFFAGCCIANAIININTLLPLSLSLDDFIDRYKYNSDYEIVWWFVAGILSQQKDKNPLNRFFTQINSGSRDFIGFYHNTLLLRCLDEAICASNKEEIACMQYSLRLLNNSIERYLLLPEKIGKTLLNYLNISPYFIEYSNIKTILLNQLMSKKVFNAYSSLYTYGASNNNILVYKALAAIKKLNLNHDDVIEFLLRLLDKKLYDYELTTIDAIKALGDLCPFHYRNRIITDLEKLLKTEKEQDVNSRAKNYDRIAKGMVGNQHYKVIALSMADGEITIRSTIADTFKKLNVEEGTYVDATEQINHLLQVIMNSDSQTLRSTIEALQKIIMNNLFYQEYVAQLLLRILVSYKYNTGYRIKYIFEEMKKVIDTLIVLQIKHPVIIHALLALLRKSNVRDLVGNDGGLAYDFTRLRGNAVKALATLGIIDQEIIDAILMMLIEERNVIAAESLLELNIRTPFFINAVLMMFRFGGYTNEHRSEESSESIARILAKVGLVEFKIIDVLLDEIMNRNSYKNREAAKAFVKLNPRNPIIINKLLQNIDNQLIVEVIGELGITTKNVINALCNTKTEDNQEKAKQELTTKILIKLCGFDYLVVNNLLVVEQLLVIFKSGFISYGSNKIINDSDLKNSILDQCEKTVQLRLPLIKGLIYLLKENTQEVDFIYNALLRLKYGYEKELEDELLNYFINVNNKIDFEKIGLFTKILLKLNVVSIKWKEYIIVFFDNKNEFPSYNNYSSYNYSLQESNKSAIINFMSQFDWSAKLPLKIFLHPQFRGFEKRKKIFDSTPSLPLLNGYFITQDVDLISRLHNRKIAVTVTNNTLSLYEQGRCDSSVISDRIVSYLGPRFFRPATPPKSQQSQAETYLPQQNNQKLS